MEFARKHHYIPVFYQLGFANNNRIAVYDKIEDKFLENQSPKNFLYEKDTNNLVHNGRITHSIENTVYSKVDSLAAPIINKINRFGASLEPDLNSVELMGLLHFLVTMYWRNPVSNHVFKKIILRLGFNNSHFGIENKNGDKKNRIEFLSPSIIADIIEGKSSSTKFIKHIANISSGVLLEASRIYDKTMIYSSNNGLEILLSDQPYLVNNNHENFENVLGEFAVPLNRYKLLVGSELKCTKLRSDMVFSFNFAQIQNARRHVVAFDINSLRKYILLYKKVLNQYPEEHFSERFFIGLRNNYKISPLNKV